MSKKPFPWYGGKSALVSVLLPLLPAHQVYVEVFGGSAALLFAKAPRALEVLNDLDSGVVNFFRVLRDPAQADALQQRLALTPYAREEYYDCLRTWQETGDPVEQARRWYCAVVQTRNNALQATGWRSTKVPASNPARAWSHGSTHLADFVARLGFRRAWCRGQAGSSPLRPDAHQTRPGDQVWRAGGEPARTLAALLPTDARP